jgi:hypothetical protein
MQQIRTDSPDDAARRFVAQIDRICTNSEDEPILHQQDLFVREAIVNFFGRDPDNRIQKNRMLSAIQNYVLPKINGYWSRKDHPDFWGKWNESMKWLVNLSGENPISPILTLELDNDANSLCAALAKAIYTRSFRYKVRGFGDASYDRRLQQKREKLKQKLVELVEDRENNQTKIDEHNYYLANITNIQRAARIDRTQNREGDKIELDVADPSSGMSIASHRQYLIDYLNSDPGGKLSELKSKKYPQCNCYTLWKLKSQSDKISMAEIAQILDIGQKGDTPDNLWKKCVKCIQALDREFTDRHN